ncbi:MAG TPA: 16S rRNA (cytosine(1402)-N(4))-methyltransferase RsmH [Anaerolineae bacterium]
MELPHLPVLLSHVTERLAPHPNENVIDGTIGAGGHAEALLEKTGPNGRLLGLDADPSALKISAERLARFGERVTLVHANFTEMERVARELEYGDVRLIILDLGLSSMQLADKRRGFSFDSDSLDMRAGTTGEVTAADLVNSLSELELANLIYRLGEEPRSRRIAKAIVNERPFSSAKELSETIERAVGRRGRIHPATRTFQALRMGVNHELENLEQALPQTVALLEVGGRVGILTFHSLEDRIVKRYLKDETRVRVLTKHPVQATREEELANPRARSAKLRVAEKIVN